MNWIFRMFIIPWVSLVLLASIPLSAPASSTPVFHPMPPHPSLIDQYLRGELAAPYFTSDPLLAAQQGINISPDGPLAMTGSIKALAVLVDFSDKVKTVQATFFDSLLFASPITGRGSVRDYYNEVSYGQVDVVAVTLPSSLGWKRAPQPISYYVNNSYCSDGVYPHNCQKLAEDIVDAINSVVNFSQYDNNGDGTMEPIMIIHAGPGAELTGNKGDIWSHSWTLKTPRNYDGVTISKYVVMPEYWKTVSSTTSDMTIGVYAHEMGHGFWGLPDLYDRTGDSYGVGDWSLMAGGCWNGPNSGGWGTDGSSPAWPDAWSRIKMGFTSPVDASGTPASRNIPQAYNNPAPAQTIFKLTSSALGPQEYFLVENRQKASGSYDEYLPAAGLFIWHVDEAMNVSNKQNDNQCTAVSQCNCDDSSHFLVALQQADGLMNLEKDNNGGDAGDPYPGSGNNRNWTRSTTPESSSWYTCSSNNCISVTNISNSGPTMSALLGTTCFAGSHHLYLPLIVKGGGWQTIMTEDFEGVFPGTKWQVFDNNGGTYGEYYWGKRTCRPYAGNYSGWGVGAGANGTALPCGNAYPDYASSWMLYGPFTLVGSQAADLSFKLWLNSELHYDGLCGLASIDGVNFYGTCTSGSTGGWVDKTLDLTNVPTLGNLTGRPNVWVALIFESDNIFNYAEGSYVDNIVLRKCALGGSCPASSPAASSDESGIAEFPLQMIRPSRPR